MKLRKLVASAMAAALTLGLAACGSSGSAAGSSDAASASGEKTLNLKLAHNMAEDHAVHLELSSFAEAVKEKSNGSINIQIFPNGTLGSETDMISQIQSGALDMAKVSASTLGNFSKQYNAFSVPYVFDDKEHYYSFMDSQDAKDVFTSTEGDGFIGLTWLDSGARSFYTVDKAIREPADLKGLKIRTMDSQMAIDMMTALGGSATVMGYSDIYTGLQQGVINGAENNITALRDHGEVAKFYSYDEHTRIPDVVVISAKVWKEMSPEQQKVMSECAQAATDDYKTKWAEFEEQVKQQATEKFNVTFVEDVDKKAFQDACAGIVDGLKSSDPDAYAVVEKIQAQSK